ncbi:ABC transporter substrate-binding protein [Sphingomonas crusticola]|uniref:ABC transporter substrate-binding protein n=1 Tax=Sphingomonas crusticola TaxID=1697973 RepID=UPI000E273652|nr:ABC transporter substrate-binding protein [Sphingomonas crusticola]
MPRAASSRRAGPIGLAAFVIVSIALLVAFAPARRGGAGPAAFDLSKPLPDTIPPGVVLRVGDPVTQWIFQHEGWEKQLPFKIEWAQITGGPDVTEAFHAGALDVGLGASVPPIHAAWTGIPVRIVAFRDFAEPDRHQAWVFGVSPNAKVASVADLKGKRIAFSPSQVQAVVVLQTLKAAGLKTSDVTLVELPSSIGGDVYTNALASGEVDVAPLGAGIVVQRYIRKFGSDGARLLKHPPFRDDALNVYVPETVLADPGKAAALKLFIRYWGKAQAWINAHPEALAEGYYGRHQGLPIADGRLIVGATGKVHVPGDWSRARAVEQAAIDILGQQTGRPRLDAATLFDPRFETIAATAAQGTAS